MLPRDLQFELKPRRALLWLRPMVVAACLLLAGALLMWLVPRQRELDRLRDELDRVSQSAAARLPTQASGPLPAWQATADQDGRLFGLQLEPRLLEIERCTGPKAVVTRITHDEASGVTTLELTLAAAEDLSPMLECFNTSDDKLHPWRLSDISAMSATSGSPAVGQRVILRHG